MTPRTCTVTKTDIPARFREIEWPVLILLSWVVDWAEWRGIFPAGDGGCWPEKELPADKYRLDSCKLDVFIWLGWYGLLLFLALASLIVLGSCCMLCLVVLRCQTLSHPMVGTLITRT